MIRLEKLLDPAAKKRLLAAIERRVSCRSFAGGPSVAEWAALSYAAGRYSLPGARVVLAMAEESLFSGTLLGMGRITGCRAVAAVVASLGEPHSRLHSGILGEALCLEAVAMGLGCCWVSGSYKKKQLQLSLAPDETLMALIALGVPAVENTPDTRKRKPLEKLCQGDPALWPEEVRRAAEMVQLAPSAMNMQPWRMALEHDCLRLEAPDRSQLDVGIALIHAEAALKTPHAWHYTSLGAEARVR